MVDDVKRLNTRQRATRAIGGGTPIPRGSRNFSAYRCKACDHSFEKVGICDLGGLKVLQKSHFVRKLTHQKTSSLDFDPGLIMLNQLSNKRTFETFEASIACGTHKNVGATRCDRPLII